MINVLRGVFQSITPPMQQSDWSDYYNVNGTTLATPQKKSHALLGA